MYHINAFLYVMNELFFLAALKILSFLLTFNGLLIIYLDIDCFVFFLSSACETYQIYRLYIFTRVTVPHIAPLGLFFFFHGKAFILNVAVYMCPYQISNL